MQCISIEICEKDLLLFNVYMPSKSDPNYVVNLKIIIGAMKDMVDIEQFDNFIAGNFNFVVGNDIGNPNLQVFLLYKMAL